MDVKAAIALRAKQPLTIETVRLEEFAALIRRDYERLGKRIKDAGIKSD